MRKRRSLLASGTHTYIASVASSKPNSSPSSARQETGLAPDDNAFDSAHGKVAGV